MALLLDSGTVHLPPIRAGAGSSAAPAEKVVVSPPAVHRTHHRAVAPDEHRGADVARYRDDDLGCQHIADPGRRCSAAGRHRREACVAAEAEAEADAGDRQDRRSSPADRRAACAARCRWRAPQATEASEAGEDASGLKAPKLSEEPKERQHPEHPQHPQHPSIRSTPSTPSTPSIPEHAGAPRSRRSRRGTSTPTRTARRRAMCTTSRLDWQRGRTSPKPRHSHGGEGEGHDQGSHGGEGHGSHGQGHGH